MDPRVKSKWIIKLLSGRCIQWNREDNLRAGVNKFCPLGVLCLVHSEETGKQWDGDWYMGSYCLLPRKVAFWAGTRIDASFDRPYLGKWLGPIAMNASGYNFKQIADAIDECL